jgi:dCTP deaminase
LCVSIGSQDLTAETLHIGPNSIDLHLHQHLRTYRGELDAHGDNPTDDVTITKEGFVMQPGKLYLARTVERTFTPHHVAKLGGRSSTGRLGLSVHQTSGLGDVGFDGTWTLSLSCVEPVRIYPGMRIAQLWLFEVSSAVSEEDQYRGRYQGQHAPTAYRGHLK